MRIWPIMERGKLLAKVVHRADYVAVNRRGSPRWGVRPGVPPDQRLPLPVIQFSPQSALQECLSFLGNCRAKFTLCRLISSPAISSGAIEGPNRPSWQSLPFKALENEEPVAKAKQSRMTLREALDRGFPADIKKRTGSVEPAAEAKPGLTTVCEALDRGSPTEFDKRMGVRQACSKS
eukprot:scpid78343/ scgid28306/ 